MALAVVQSGYTLWDRSTYAAACGVEAGFGGPVSARHVVYAGKCCPALGVVWSAPLDRGVIAILSLSRVGPQIFVPNFGA